ncbi:hypothetical protein ACHHYP_06605 [Achlya hypogyna]|uniref:Tc1-like transposase DDE domain-containing protein n=1 Tax=Achlya hypogyna TaxID=1202772 RepID=A0A1V9YSY8_ACHHY|nr:hypothetical protein ACHHYP_06605 [Achlya hypogyna]
MAAEQGHTVQYTPAYHSRLQPIELVWAYVKGIVGRAYSVDTTFADVRLRLNAAFDSLPSDVVYKCIMNSVNEVKRLDTYIKASEAADECDGAIDDSESDQEVSADDCDLSDYGLNLDHDA